MFDFIQGEKFRKIDNGRNIFYVHTHQVLEFFSKCPKNDFVLITHNSDHKIVPFLMDYLPKNCIKWFGQNVCVENDRLESIPIGLENSEWFPELNKIECMINKMSEEKKIRNLIYVNHNIHTNFIERNKPYELLINKSFATLKNGKNGENFNEYLDDIYHHKFVLCPEGNGTDTHRTWECLYMGTIPVEKRNINNSHYTDLPICFVDDWEEVTEEFLEKEYLRLSQLDHKLDKLDFNYWKKRIIGSI